MACTKVRIRRSRPLLALMLRDADNNEVRIAVGVAGRLSIVISRAFVTGQDLERDKSHYRLVHSFPA